MRWTVLAFGGLAYLAGIRSLVYFVLFASNVPLVKTVDSGTAADRWVAFTVNLSLLIAFALSHSLMARSSFKNAFLRRFPEPMLRSTYTLTAALMLSLLMWLWRPIPAVIWQVDSPAANRLLIGLGIAGWVLAAVAYYSVGHLQLLGLRQAYRKFRGQPAVEDDLVTTGIYRHLRDPMYLGFAIGMLATPLMTAGRLLLSAGLILYIVIGARYERRDLLARYGDRYVRYLRSLRSVG
jgi:protein-S-isoprenylcysteine O-methyltransferase Ste14